MTEPAGYFVKNPRIPHWDGVQFTVFSCAAADTYILEASLDVEPEFRIRVTLPRRARCNADELWYEANVLRRQLLARRAILDQTLARLTK